MAISYTPKFSHKDWIDFVDSVQAGGTNGINIRFHGIEEEFDTISSVVSQANDQFVTQSTTIATLEQQISAFGTAVARSISLAPILTALGTSTPAFDIGLPEIFGVDSGPFRATKTGGNATGVISLTLPVGGNITAFRALGSEQGSGGLELVLASQGMPGALNIIATIAVAGNKGTTPVPFDMTQNVVNPNAGVITTGTFYWIQANFTSTGPSDFIMLNGFQVLYTAS